MADVFNEKDRTTAHSLPAFRRYQFRAALRVNCDMHRPNMLCDSNDTGESPCVARDSDRTSARDVTFNDAVQGH